MMPISTITYYGFVNRLARSPRFQTPISLSDIQQQLNQIEQIAREIRILLEDALVLMFIRQRRVHLMPGHTIVEEDEASHIRTFLQGWAQHRSRLHFLRSSNAAFTRRYTSRRSR